MESMMQVYVKGSVEAVELYTKAFDATLGYNERNSDNTYLHAELSVNGQIIAIAEAGGERIVGNTMQFCLRCGKGNEGFVQKAYETLKEGAVIRHPLGSCFFSPCMMGLVDRFGVDWCIFV